jgi:hypothetical protein
MTTETKTTPQAIAPVGDAEAIEAWDGPLYDRFVQFATY